MAPPSNFLLRVFGCLNPDDFTLNANQIDAAGGGGSPGGPDGSIQFNDGGTFGSQNSFIYNKAEDSISFGSTTPGAAFEFNVHGAGCTGSLNAGDTGNLNVDLGLISPNAITISNSESVPGGGGILIESNDPSGSGAGITIQEGGAVGNGGVSIVSTNNGILMQATSFMEFDLEAGCEFSLFGDGTTPSVITIGGSIDELKFFSATSASQQTVSGSKGGNAALASLLAALAAYGLIVDGTT